MPSPPLILYAGSYHGSRGSELHFHDGFELVYVKRGKCANRTPDGEYLSLCGEITLVPPLTRHRQFDFEAVETNFVVFESDHPWCRRGMRVLHTAEDGFAGNWMEQILALYGQRRYQECNALLAVLLIHLEHDENIAACSSEFPDRFLKAVNYMANHLEENTPVNEIAQRFSYSPSYFNTLFHRYCGQSPTTFREAQRMVQARKLLLNTHASIAEIGVMCGYPLPHYFSRIFRKVHHFSPGQYRSRREFFWMTVKEDEPAIRLTH